MCWGFKKISFTLYTYVLAKISQIGAKLLRKLTPGLKNHTRNLGKFRQAVKSRKSWNLIGYFCLRKYISSTKTYAEDLSNITFNYFYENSPNDLYRFWNHKSFFTTQLLCIFQLKHYILSARVAHQSENFQTFHCSR